MKFISYDGSQYNVSLTKDELIIAVGAINEVCNGVGIDDWEFETRVGVAKNRAKDLLKELSHLLSCKHEDTKG